MSPIVQNHYVLAVHDLRKSAQFYVDVLDFKIAAEPPGWIFVARDKCMIMLGECPDDLHASKLGCHNYFAYLVVENADEWFNQIRAKGVVPLSDLADKPWGMREFSIETIDGHRIMIGQNRLSV